MAEKIKINVAFKVTPVTIQNKISDFYHAAAVKIRSVLFLISKEIVSITPKFVNEWIDNVSIFLHFNDALSLKQYLLNF